MEQYEFESSFKFDNRDQYSLPTEKTWLESFTERAIIGSAYALMAATAPISLPYCYTSTKQNEVAIIGRAGGQLQQKTGRFLIIPGIDIYEKISLEPEIFKIDQNNKTLDDYEIQISGSGAFKINEPLKFVKSVTKETRDNNLVGNLVKAEIRKIVGKNNFSRIQNPSSLINDVCFNLNHDINYNWGIQLISDKFDVKILITKRGEDGPGDPMMQILNLLKENLNLNENSSLPQDAFNPNIKYNFENGLGKIAKAIGVDNINSMMKEHDKTVRKNEDYKYLLELEKFTGNKAIGEFEKLGGKIYELIIEDLVNVHPALNSSTPLSLYINGSDINNPFVFNFNSLSKSFLSTIKIKLSKSDIPNLLQFDFSAFKKLVSGKLDIQGEYKNSDIAALGNFLKIYLN